MIASSAELQYFVEVAHTLNISRAAERLGISQPSLSLAIQRLEHSLGVPLLIRTKTGVQLTKGGQKLLGQVRSLLEQWEKLKSDALKDEDSISGNFTLGMHTSVGLYSLKHFLPELLAKFSDLEFKLVHDLSRKIAEDVISFKIDVGIVVNPPRHPDLVIKKLLSDEVSLWTGPQKNPLQNLSSGEAVLICDSNILQTQDILRKLDKSGYKFGRIITSSSLEIIADLVANGSGIGILPGRVAQHHAEYKLRLVSETAPKFSDSICLIYRADAQQSAASKKIIQAMQQLSKN